MAYFPNGSSGEVLDEQCATCPVGKHPEAPCPVLFVQTHYNYEQFTDGKPNEIAELLNFLVDPVKGVCQMRAVMIKYADKPEKRRIDARNVLPGMETFAREAGVLE